MKKQPIRCGKTYTFIEQQLREQIEQEYQEQIDVLITQNIEYVELCRKYEKEIEVLNELLLSAKNCNKLLNDTVMYYICNGVPEMKDLLIENERLRKLVNNETD